MQLTYHLASDVGQKRKNNEDAFGHNEESRIFVVCDGMGGHAAGEVASQLAVETVVSFFQSQAVDEDATWPFGFDERFNLTENKIRTSVQLANERIVKEIEARPQLSGMGTTITLLHFREEKAFLAHVGDSRIYRFRDGKLELLTSDHSWVNEQIKMGVLNEEDAKRHPFRNVITRALGAGSKGRNGQAEPDLLCDDVKSGDLFLLCSDGLTGMVSDEDIAAVLGSMEDLEKAGQELLDQANANGGDDNITVALVRAAL